FPGNVRELENILERALAYANGGVIEVQDLALKGARVAVAEAVPAPLAAPLPEYAPAPPFRPDAVSAPAASSAAAPPAAADTLALPPLDGLPSNLPEYLNAIERDIIMRALAQTQYNRTQAAQLLGISFRQLRYQMQKLNIQEPED
uniref:helix-turn-helix domain-containing protein n=1 Tax=Rugamonas sp. TaxID=1926287 RepID=UPI0025FF5CFA